MAAKPVSFASPRALQPYRDYPHHANNDAFVDTNHTNHELPVHDAVGRDYYARVRRSDRSQEKKPTHLAVVLPLLSACCTYNPAA